MNLYLVQHAEAKPKEEDAQRSLTERGVADAEKVASFAAQHNLVKVSKILHSGKTRAAQTAEIFADHFHPPEGVASTEGLEPLADVSIWEKKLAGYSDNLMLVGHQPHMGKLAALLLSGDTERTVVNFRMGGIVSLRRDEQNRWAIDWMLIPEMLS